MGSHEYIKKDRPTISMKSKCPYCKKKGISFFSRLLVSITNIFSYIRLSAVCQYCKKSSMLPIKAIKIQFTMVMAYMVSFPLFIVMGNQPTTTFAYFGIASVIAIGFIIPLEKDYEL